MADKIVMLALSPTMETGTIVKWNKKEGETISSGDILCEVETDKATMDYEAITEGTLLKIIKAEGTQVKVGELIAVAGEPGEDISSLLEETAPKPKGKEVSKKESENAAKNEHYEKIESEGPDRHLPQGVKASPVARELARKQGLDLQSVQGSGPGGRIIKEDIERASQRTTAPPSQQKVAGNTIPVTQKRRIIAQRMVQSITTAPHFYLTVAVTADSFLSARDTLNKSSKSKISLNAFLLKFVAEALRRNPVVNSSWGDDTIIQHGTVDIGLAVAQKDGLITPVVRNCTNKGIIEIDTELRDLVQRGREGRLAPEEYTAATFTISNLGSYGVRQFTAIINPPASAILAVGEVFQQPVPVSEGGFVTRNTINLTLSCDHRVIDGAVAAVFAKDLKNIMENPITVLY